MIDVKKALNPPVMGSICPHSIKNIEDFTTERKRTIYCGLKVVIYRSPQ